MPGQARATTPAAASMTASRRWPTTGPAEPLEKPRHACSAPDAKAAMANRITNAPTVMPGHAMAMMPMAMANRPRQMSDAVIGSSLGWVCWVKGCWQVNGPQVVASRRPPLGCTRHRARWLVRRGLRRHPDERARLHRAVGPPDGDHGHD